MNKFLESKSSQSCLFLTAIVVGVWLSSAASPVTYPIIKWLGSVTIGILDLLKSMDPDPFGGWIPAIAGIVVMIITMIVVAVLSF